VGGSVVGVAAHKKKRIPEKREAKCDAQRKTKRSLCEEDVLDDLVFESLQERGSSAAP
jgi:hypothetical protein